MARKRKPARLIFSSPDREHCLVSTPLSGSRARSANTPETYPTAPVAAWIARTPRAFLSRCHSGDRSDSSFRWLGVRLVQADHNSADQDQDDRDQQQLNPAEGCCRFPDCGPVDFAAEPTL